MTSDPKIRTYTHIKVPFNVGMTENFVIQCITILKVMFAYSEDATFVYVLNVINHLFAHSFKFSVSLHRCMILNRPIFVSLAKLLISMVIRHSKSLIKTNNNGPKSDK